MSLLAETLKQEFIPGCRVWGVEVGVHRGGNAAEMLSEVPDLILVMVDHWRFRGEDVDLTYADRPNIQHGPKQYDVALEATAKFRERRIIVPLDSVTAASLFPDGWFDFVFLDGDHRLEGVRADLAAWVPKIKPGGFIAGDDLDSGHPAWNVRQAVEELGKPFEKRRGSFFMRL